MNDERESFEQRLHRQSVKGMPTHWRGEILRACEVATEATTARSKTPSSWLSVFNQKLSALLWPHPKAWAGLAMVWVIILVLNFADRDKSVTPAERIAPSPEVTAELKKQQLLFAELMGPEQNLPVDHRKKIQDRPRSERTNMMMA